MILVLRLGHRCSRDQRITTHCALVARAFGADGMIYCGEKDKKLVKTIKRVVKNWGNGFYIKYEENYREVIKTFNGIKVQLTMYGISWKEKISLIRESKNVLIVIGSEKVPADVYKLVDLNLSILNQPHSEVAALAVFLYDYFKGKEKKFKNAKLHIIPRKNGKYLVSK